MIEPHWSSGPNLPPSLVDLLEPQDSNEDEDNERDEVIDYDELLEHIDGDDNDYNMYM